MAVPVGLRDGVVIGECFGIVVVVLIIVGTLRHEHADRGVLVAVGCDPFGRVRCNLHVVEGFCLDARANPIFFVGIRHDEGFDTTTVALFIVICSTESEMLWVKGSISF